LSWEIGGLGVFPCLLFLKGRGRGDGREGERKASSKKASEEKKKQVKDEKTKHASLSKPLSQLTLLFVP